MRDMKRLGPQDPLSWIRDTREKAQESPEPRKPLLQEKRYRIQSDDEVPVEITVIVKGEGTDRTICVRVSEEGKKPTTIEVSASNGVKRTRHKGSDVSP